MVDGIDEASAASGTYETTAEALKDSPTAARYWLNAIALAGKDEKDWRETAKTVIGIYDTTKKSAFNILHSNTEVIRAVAYNSLPSPDIRTRFGDPNQVAPQGAVLIERCISYGIDEYDFDDLMKKTVLDAVLPGRGVDWVEYDPLMRTVQIEGPDGKPVIGADGKPTTEEQVVWQTAKCVRIAYEDFRRGPGKSWEEIPWAARRKHYTRAELMELPGIDALVAKTVPLDTADTELMADATEREKNAFKRAAVWEIWDKGTRKVFWVAEGYPQGVLAIQDDPLGLLDFLPVPRPLMPIGKPDSCVPVTPYEVYKDQAEELNVVSERIIALVRLLKFRGIRASEIKELDGIEELDDGEFKPSNGALALLGNGQSLDDAIWVMPIDKIIIVVRELIMQREQIKQVIFEIMGLADIMRGAVDPREKLGQSQIKAQQGSLRMSDLQNDVQRFVRDLFRLKAQIIAGKYTDKTFTLINGGPVAPEVLAYIRNDVQRSYSIDVETDSTIRGDLAKSQQTYGMFLQSIAQFGQSIGPLIASPNNPAGVIPPELALVIVGGFIRQFKLGKEVDDKLAEFMEKAAQGGLQQPPDPQKQADEQAAKELGKAGMVAEVQTKQATAQKVQGEAQGQQIENQRMAAAPIVPPAEGFIQ